MSSYCVAVNMNVAISMPLDIYKVVIRSFLTIKWKLVSLEIQITVIHINNSETLRVLGVNPISENSTYNDAAPKSIRGI